MNPNFKQKAREIIETFLEQLNSQFKENWIYEGAYPILKLGKKHVLELIEEDPGAVYEFLKKAKMQIDEGIKLYEKE